MNGIGCIETDTFYCKLDLYGADEYDDEPQTANKDATTGGASKSAEVKSEDKKEEAPPAPKAAAKIESVADTKPPPPLQGQPIPTAIPTNPIATYVSSSSNDYSGYNNQIAPVPSYQHQDHQQQGGMGGGGGGDGDVRPSEMRDEG